MDHNYALFCGYSISAKYIYGMEVKLPIKVTYHLVRSINNSDVIFPNDNQLL